MAGIPPPYFSKILFQSKIQSHRKNQFLENSKANNFYKDH
ncbi:hypothetical protein J627_0074 [Acinetobacter sp. 1245593]|nr:hypothetical protein J627_0074 [Acinetobacter sp. 1245593]